MLGHHRAEPDAVVDRLAHEALDRIRVTMPYDRGRLVDERAPAQKQADVDVEILTAKGETSGAEGRIKSTQIFEHVSAKRHVRAGAEEAGRIREQRLIGRRLPQR